MWVGPRLLLKFTLQLLSLGQYINATKHIIHGGDPAIFFDAVFGINLKIEMLSVDSSHEISNFPVFGLMRSIFVNPEI